MKQGDTHRDCRYGPLKAAWVALFQPVKAVRCADHLSVSRAWAVHVVGMGVLGLTVFILAAWDLNGGGVNPAGLANRISEIVTTLWSWSGDARTWFALVGVTLTVELTWAVSAAIVMSWCACEERYRDSYLRALRRLLLLTPHLTVLVGLLGIAYVCMHNSSMLRRGIYSGLNTEGLLIWMVLFTPVCLWALWVVLKALGVHRAPAMCRWPLGCEGCGYVLAGLDQSGSCPECGKAITETVSLANRPGIAPGGGFGWWVLQTCRAISRPTAFGRRMHVMSSDTGHRRCLGWTVVMQAGLLPVAWVGLTLLFRLVTQTPMEHMRQAMAGLLMICLMAGLLIIATTVAVSLLIAGIAGVTEGRHLKRNLIPTAARAVGYLSGFAVLWVAVAWCNVGLTFLALHYDLIPVIEARYNIAGEKLLVYWHYGVALIGILIYGVLIERVTRAARHANW